MNMHSFAEERRYLAENVTGRKFYKFTFHFKEDFTFLY